MSPAQQEMMEKNALERKRGEEAKGAVLTEGNGVKSDGHAPAVGEKDTGHGGGGGEEIPADLKRPGAVMIILATLVLLGLLAAIFAIGWFPHQKAEEQIKADAAERASEVPVVETIKPLRSPGWTDLRFFCDVKPNQETQIYPQATGYMKTLNVDIQDKVKKGQVLAEIDEKDVDAQLAQAKAQLTQAHADVVKSQSDYDLAQRTYDRYMNLKAPGGGLIATQQEVDEKQTARDTTYSALSQANASVGVAEANVQRLEVLQSYQKVIAPFDGTITTRNYDIGALLMPGTTAPGKEMFTIVDSSTMRVFVNIPQVDATNIKVGQEATLTVRNYPGRVFAGTVARESTALDPNTRTESFELDFANPDGALVAGMSGEAKLKVVDATPTLLVPTSALIFNSAGVQVMTVKDGKVHFAAVKLGRDLGIQLEILQGLGDDDEVVTNPGARLAEGDQVEMKETTVAAVPMPAPVAATQRAGK